MATGDGCELLGNLQDRVSELRELREGDAALIQKLRTEIANWSADYESKCKEQARERRIFSEEITARDRRISDLEERSFEEAKTIRNLNVLLTEARFNCQKEEEAHVEARQEVERLKAAVVEGMRTYVVLTKLLSSVAEWIMKVETYDPHGFLQLQLRELDRVLREAFGNYPKHMEAPLVLLARLCHAASFSAGTRQEIMSYVKTVEPYAELSIVVRGDDYWAFRTLLEEIDYINQEAGDLVVGVQVPPRKRKDGTPSVDPETSPAPERLVDPLEPGSP